MQKRIWTQQEEETLIRLYEDPQVFPKDIAKMLGRTLPQVYNKARAMGLNAPMERIRMAGREVRVSIPYDGVINSNNSNSELWKKKEQSILSK